MLKFGNHKINRWTYKINQKVYVLNICQPTAEAKNAGLTAGDRFSINGTIYEFDGETAVSLRNVKR